MTFTFFELCGFQFYVIIFLWIIVQIFMQDQSNPVRSVQPLLDQNKNSAVHFPQNAQHINTTKIKKGAQYNSKEPVKEENIDKNRKQTNNLKSSQSKNKRMEQESNHDSCQQIEQLIKQINLTLQQKKPKKFQNVTQNVSKKSDIEVIDKTTFQRELKKKNENENKYHELKKIQQKQMNPRSGYSSSQKQKSSKVQMSTENNSKQYSQKVQERTSKNQSKKSKFNDAEDSKLLKFPQIEDNNFELFHQYRKNILKTVQQKIPFRLQQAYSLSHNIKCIRSSDYPDISFTMYKRVLWIWEDMDKRIMDLHLGEDINTDTNQHKNTTTNSKLKFLKYGHLTRLNQKKWLNDEIMSSYITLIRQKIREQQKLNYSRLGEQHYNYIIMDSLQTQSIFNKMSQKVQEDKIKQISNIFLKNKIGKIKSQDNKDLYIFVINHSQHWFFITVRLEIIDDVRSLQQFYRQDEQNFSKNQPQNQKLNKCQLVIAIYDSRSSNKDLSDYKSIKTIKKIRTYFKHSLSNLSLSSTTKIQEEIQIKLVKSQTYPQQNNNYDCGVMTLCGIKDIVRDYLIWSFSNEDLYYKRVLMTKEIIQEQLCGFYM